ncbi:hypothetical protein NDN08_000667 [Rhodosorus marinus]|uniref:Uncharacterized protein n=1 Tax=Rhodosorus marinus TaxID=101924 RepID=A0AAV8UNM4_9RHOD|nr:hypothetical protein NDN08_000667 [Rhodosorus marinus]
MQHCAPLVGSSSASEDSRPCCDWAMRLVPRGTVFVAKLFASVMKVQKFMSGPYIERRKALLNCTSATLTLQDDLSSALALPVGTLSKLILEQKCRHHNFQSLHLQPTRDKTHFHRLRARRFHDAENETTKPFEELENRSLVRV